MPLLLGSLSSCSRTAFACCHEGRDYLLTSASAVAYATQVAVHKPGVPEPFRACVQHISLDCELAVLGILDTEADEDITRAQAGGRAPSAPHSARSAASTSAPSPSAYAKRVLRAAAQQQPQRQRSGVPGSGAAPTEEEEQAEEEEEEEADEEERFWQGVRPLVLGGLPQIRQPVQVLLPEASHHQHDQERLGTVSSITNGAVALDKDGTAEVNSRGSSSSGGLDARSGEASTSSSAVPIHHGVRRGVRAGIVSSVEAVTYPSSMLALLGLVVSARVGGGSACIGAPVVSPADGRCVGVVMKRVGRSKRRQLGGEGGGPRPGAGRRRGRARRGVGQTAGVQPEEGVMAVSVPLMQRFLAEVAASHVVAEDTAAAAGVSSPGPVAAAGRLPLTCVALPSLGLRVQALPSRVVRQSLGMSEAQQGVLLLDANPCTAASQVLLPGDVLVRVNDAPVNDEGMVTLRHAAGKCLLPFTAYVAMQTVGSTLSLGVLRQGRELQLSARLSVPPRLLPAHLGNQRPQYLVIGGLVLARCSVPYLQAAFGPQWPKVAPVKLLDKIKDFPRGPDEEVIVVAECQPLKSLDGYQAGALQHRRVERVNGVQAVSMLQVAKQVLESEEEFIRLDLEAGTVVVLSAAQAQADTKLMLRQYEVKFPVSDDLAEQLPFLTRAQQHKRPLKLGAARRGR